jgi:branched-chain amino acid transport system substrate-binding protein
MRMLHAVRVPALVGLLGGLILSGGALAAEPPIRIGEINTYSGVPAGFTLPYRQAIEMAVDEVNSAGGLLGRKVEVLFRDDKGNPADAIRHAQELVRAEQVDLLAGTFLSNIGLAVSDFARQQKVLLDRAAKLPYRKWAVIGPNYEYGRRAWETFWERMQQLTSGLTVVGEHWPALGKIEPGGYITALLAEKPEAVYVSLFGSDWIAFAREGMKRGLFQNRYFVGILLGEPEYMDPLGQDVPQGMLVTGYPWYDVRTPAHQEFVQRFARRTGHHPVQGSLVGYITFLAIFDAIRKAGSTDTEKLVSALEGLQVQTPIGPITFRPGDHQSTMGAWVGRTMFDPQRGTGIMVNWEYVPGESVLPPETEVRKMREVAR